MNDIRKILDIINETTTAGAVSTISQPMTTERREDYTAENSDTPQKPQVLEYGNWENSALSTSKKLKAARKKASKIVKSVYGEDMPGEKVSVAEGSLNEGYIVKNGSKYLKGHPAGGAQMTWVTDKAKATVFKSKGEISKAANMRGWSIIPAQQGVAEGDGISKDEETKFHAKLDKLVHDTFGKRKDELEEGPIDVKLDQQAQKIADKLTTDKNLEKLRGMAYDSTVYRALTRYFDKHNIPETIYNRVAAIMFQKINQQGVEKDSKDTKKK